MEPSSASQRATILNWTRHTWSQARPRRASPGPLTPAPRGRNHPTTTGPGSQHVIAIEPVTGTRGPATPTHHRDLGTRTNAVSGNIAQLLGDQLTYRLFRGKPLSQLLRQSTQQPARPEPTSSAVQKDAINTRYICITAKT